ncbi:MAG: hypothetical protein JW839_15310 [Candidatus Lokiarchaeota archaeon]|nr:hypothetical protein [Candidatus Lokiarchaeota archaeon]
MARRGPSTAQALAGPIGKHGRVVLALFSTGFLAVNVCIALVVLHHAYPMLVYPAFVAFLAVYFLFRRRLPPRSASIGFVVACQFVVILAVLRTASSNNHVVDFWKLLEPAYFLPSIAAYLALRRVVDPRKQVAGTLLVAGGLFVVLSFVSMLPGNPVVSLLENPPGGHFELIDTQVPASVIRDLFLFYHLPVVLGSFGSAALLYGVVAFYTDLRVTDLSFFALIIATVFSIYAFGVGIAWHVFEQQGSSQDGPLISLPDQA